MSSVTNVADLLDALQGDLERTVDAVAVVAQATVSGFEDALPSALRGWFPAVERVTALWDRLLEDLLDRATSRLPDWRIERGADLRLFHHAEEATVLVALLRDDLTHAPFSRYAMVYGLGVGPVLGCVRSVREALPGLSPLALPGESPTAPEASVADVERFGRLVRLARARQTPPLEYVRRAFDLSFAELGTIFGVKRQAVEQWAHSGVPGARLRRLDELVAAAELLERKLKAGRLPLVARRPAAAFGGRSLLEAAAAGDSLRDRLEAAFDWSTTA